MIIGKYVQNSFPETIGSVLRPDDSQNSAMDQLRIAQWISDKRLPQLIRLFPESPVARCDLCGVGIKGATLRTGFKAQLLCAVQKRA